MMLESIFSSTIETSITLTEVLICTATSLVLGFITAKIYMDRGKYSKSFVGTLVILPAIVQFVIMLVNGNLGTGLAVMGAFSLVRFRSAAGTARDISYIFLAMAIGLATGMGFIAIGIIFLVVVGGMNFLISRSSFGEIEDTTKILKVVIPDNLDYTTVFDDIFNKYTKKVMLERVKTTNMGSLYELKYEIVLINELKQKEFIDELRCRNSNLNIVCSRPAEDGEEL